MARSTAELRVARAWRKSYDPALAVRAGDTVTPLREDAEYPGWVWCENRAGLGGWLPRTVLNGASVTCDFDSCELSVQPGDLVVALATCLGWTRVRAQSGQVGWVPTSCLGR